MFSIVIGFALTYNVAFGEQLSTFTTPGAAFNYLMRSQLGNSDTRIVYEASPVAGAVFIVLYVLASLLILMNVFRAIMVSGLSDARTEASLESNKRWAQVEEKAGEAWSLANKSLRLDLRFRKGLPGLAARLSNWKKKQKIKEKAREDFYAIKEHGEKQLTLEDLGAANPSFGRRPRRGMASTNQDAIEDVHVDDNDSEPDLGRLHSMEQLTGYHFSEDGDSSRGGGSGGFPGNGHAQPELEPKAMKLVIEASTHVASGVVERARGARRILVGEMVESRQVLQGISNVLEVLSRRSEVLADQQRQLIDG